MSCESCKAEFKVKNFGFSGVLPNVFYHLQWSSNPWLYFFYRLFMMLYVVIWMIVGYITDLEDNFWQFFTYWTEGLMVVYFIVAFGVSVYGVTKGKSEKSSSLRWFQRLNWMLFSTATASAFIVSAIFWFILAPTLPAGKAFRPITFHLHVINSILFLIEIFMVAFPVRIYHFVYPIAYNFSYGIFLLILHYTGVNSRVYPPIDFENNFRFAIGFGIRATLIAPIIVHLVVFILFLLRNFIASKIKNTSTKYRED